VLPHHGGLIVEYAGMPDLPDYMEGIRHKERVYAANCLQALFLYPDDLHGPRWPEKALVQIHRAAPDSMRAEASGYDRPQSHAYF